MEIGDWDIAYINTDWIAEANAKYSLEDLAPLIAMQHTDNYPEGWSDSLSENAKNW